MSNNKIAILGLGYVGLPLLRAFSKFYDVIGFDISTNRINDLKSSSIINNKSEVKEVVFTPKRINYLMLISILLPYQHL